MASSQGQQKTSSSPFNIFRSAPWTNGRKKAKQAKLGEENNMYFHPELKRWVERGKEEEAEREAAGPPPPPVLSAGSLTSTPLSKRSLSQRYVLQPNLSISSSMASLAGSMSQNDLAGLAACYGAGDSFSGPPSAIGSTAPSPPASSNCLIPPAAFAASSPGSGGASPAAFFVPSPRQPSTPPSPGSFFLPSTAHTPDDAPAAAVTASSVNGSHENTPRSSNTSAGGAGAALCDGDPTQATAAATRPPPPAAANGASGHDTASAASDQGARVGEGQEDAEDGNGAASFSGAAENSGDGLRGADSGRGPPLLGSATSAGQHTLSGAELSLRNSLNASMASASAAHVHSGCQSAGSLSALTEGSAAADSLSFPNTVDGQVDSPVAFVAAMTHGPDVPPQPPLAREYRRRLGGGAAANASDGGAAISLHEGMGIVPASRPHVVDAQAGEAAAVAANGLVAPSAVGAEEGVQEGAAAAAADGGGDAVGDGGPAPEAGGQAAESLVNGDAAAAIAAADAAPAADASTASVDAAPANSTGFGGGTGGAVYSQYYYQQYAYLYQYAVEQGYSETDAVAYAQYYAAVYAQQYEAQAPEGQLGRAETAAAAGVDGVEAGAAAGDSAAPGADAGASAAATATPEVAVGTAVEAAWQVVGGAVEEEAPLAVQSGAEEVEDVGRREQDPVYVTAAAPPAHIGPTGACMAGMEAVAEAEAGPVLISAAPLPADLTAAATAAAQHHQSAVTAAVAAAAAAVEQQLKRQQQEGGPLGTDAAVPATAAVADASASGLSTAGTGPAPQQLLLGLGAAGARRLTQLSSAVASLGATVAAAAPVAAALSAAASTAAAVACGGGFAGLEAGLSEDDFDRIMHPGDPAKLDGPLPWELPEHLRTGRKFLALCANWQLANPGQPYAPHLLLQQPPLQQQQQQQALGVAADGADVALHAAEGSSGSAGGAGPVAAAPEQGQQQQPRTAAEVAEEEQLSSYERACRLAQFGQPAAALLPSAKPSATTCTVPAAPAVEKPELPPPQTQPQEVSQQPQEQPLAPVSPDSEIPAPNSEAVAPVEAITVSGPAEHVASPTEQQQQPELIPYEPSATQVVDGGVPTLTEELLEQAGDDSGAEVADADAAASELPRLGTVDAVSFFEELGEQVHTPAAAVEPPVAVVEDLAEPGPVVVAPEEAQASEGVAAAAEASPGDALEDGGVEDGGDEAEGAHAATAAAAAAAIDSVVAALEQLRSSAAAGADGGVAVADPVTGTALLLQIQSSLAQTTEALAGMGVDVSALASLAGVPKLQTPPTQTEWTPGASHKRPRMEASPATPTRAAAAGTEGVVTPLLPPGPLIVRPVAEELAADGVAAACAVGERFQQLGRRLSDASAEAAAALAAAAAEGATAAGSALSVQPLVHQQQSVVLSLTIVPAPEVDVSAVEERVRCEERAAAETRLAAVVDSEREAAALVIAGVERERDGLAQRCEELEAALAAAVAERKELVARLGEAEADCRQARAAGEVAEAERGALTARLSEVTAERDALAAALAAERSEKAALAEALSAARCDSEELRRRYAERFSALSSELEATRGSLAELQGEHDELLLCLGQESTKVEVLTGALREAGGDPEPLIERIEAEYETMGLGQGEEAEEAAAEVEGQGDCAELKCEKGGCRRQGEGEFEEAREGEVGQQAAAAEGSGEGVGEAPSDQEAAGEGWEGEDLVL